MKIAVFLIAACAMTTGAMAQTFNMTVEQFRAGFDVHAKNDSQLPNEAATIKSITKLNPTTYRATFNDASFKRMVKMWKEIDVANGRFALKDRLELKTGDGGKLVKVAISSSRSDMNLFHFLGTFASTARVFNPSASEQQIQDLIKEVGVMSGDDDPKIGTIRSSFTKGAAVACLSQPSNLSTDVACAFTPRF